MEENYELKSDAIDFNTSGNNEAVHLEASSVEEIQAVVVGKKGKKKGIIAKLLERGKKK